MLNQTQGFLVKGEEKKVYNLKKGFVWTIKQALRTWYSEISGFYLEKRLS